MWAKRLGSPFNDQPLEIPLTHFFICYKNEVSLFALELVVPNKTAYVGNFYILYNVTTI